MLKRIGAVFLSLAIMLTVPLAGYAAETEETQGNGEWLDFTVGHPSNSVGSKIQYLRGVPGKFAESCFGEGDQMVTMPKTTETVKVPAMNVDNLVEWTRTYPMVTFEEYSGKPTLKVSAGAWTCIDNQGEPARLWPTNGSKEERAVVVDLGQEVDAKYIQWFRPKDNDGNYHTCLTRIAVAAENREWSDDLFYINDSSKNDKTYWMNVYLKDEDGDGTGIGTKIRYIKIFKDGDYGPYITGLRVWAAKPAEDVAPSVQRVELTADKAKSTAGKQNRTADLACDKTAMTVSKSNNETEVLYDQGTFDTLYSNAENADAANTPTQLKVDLDSSQILTDVRIALRSETKDANGSFQDCEAYHNFKVIAVLDDDSEVLLHEQGADYYSAMKLLNIDMKDTAAKGKAVKSIIIRKTDGNTAADVLGVSNILCVADSRRVKAEINANKNTFDKISNYSNEKPYISVKFSEDMITETVKSALSLVKVDGDTETPVAVELQAADESNGCASEFRIPYSALDSYSTYKVTLAKDSAKAAADEQLYQAALEQSFETGTILKGDAEPGKEWKNVLKGKIPVAGQASITEADLKKLTDEAPATGASYSGNVINVGSVYGPQYYVWDLGESMDLSAAAITTRNNGGGVGTGDCHGTVVAVSDKNPIDEDGTFSTSGLSVMKYKTFSFIPVSGFQNSDRTAVIEFPAGTKGRYVAVYRNGWGGEYGTGNPGEVKYGWNLNEISVYGIDYESKITKLEATANDEGCSVTLAASNVNAGSKVWVAAYSDGKLADVKLVDVNGAEKTITIGAKKGDTIRAYVWNDTLTPFAEYKECTVE